MTTLEKREREKYKRMWAFPAYRGYSPGANAVPLFLEHANWAAGDSIVDLGCGTGHAGHSFRNAGLKVTLVDFCREAVEVEGIDFIEKSIWNLFGVSWDWLYCVDVLEHIPPTYLNQTLGVMSKVCRRGGYLQIACFDDSCGSLIGEKLHLSIHPPVEWFQLISQYFKIDNVLKARDERYARFIISKKVEE